MNKLLCKLGIHRYGNWTTQLNDEGKPKIYFEVNNEFGLNQPEIHNCGQVIIQSQECSCCGKVRFKRRNM